MKIVYLDNSATTEIKPEVLKSMLPYMKANYGNPSSIYSLGLASKQAIEDARTKVANAINADPSEIYFTSGGTESDNWAIKGIIFNHLSDHIYPHIITTQVEHPAVYNSCKYLEYKLADVTFLPVDNTCTININQLKNTIQDNTVLMSIMYANNEVGSIQPIKEISDIAKKHKIILHTDAVQAVGHTKIDVKELGVDLLSMSGHKFHAPKGIGALYVKKGTSIDQYLNGGSQEKNFRAGTENVANIVGMGTAIELATNNIEQDIEYIKQLRNLLISGIMNNISNCYLNSCSSNTLPGIINITFIGINAETLLLLLNNYGIFASAGSACSSHSNDPSRTLMAMGLSEQDAHSSVRFSIGTLNSVDDINYTVSKLIDIVDYLRR